MDATAHEHQDCGCVDCIARLRREVARHLVGHSGCSEQCPVLVELVKRVADAMMRPYVRRIERIERRVAEDRARAALRRARVARIAAAARRMVSVSRPRESGARSRPRARSDAAGGSDSDGSGPPPDPPSDLAPGRDPEGEG